MKFISTLLLSLLVILFACSNDVEKTIEENESKDKDLTQFEATPKVNDTLFTMNYGGYDYKVEIKAPEGMVKGTILVLQGWNFPITDWCDSTTLCEKALKQGYNLVFPEMGKSIYSEEIYVETRSDWKKYPTRKWLRDSVIGTLQSEFNLFEENGNNYVLGLSTGGRGALLLALDLPKIFAGCATLSGDYDQSMFPYDNLYIGYYGEMKSFEKRWKEDENPNKLILMRDLNVPLYMGHGMNDNVVPYKHFELMKEFLGHLKPDVKIVYHTDSLAQHNYTYWNSEVDNVLEFFGGSKN
jgi:putative tributyrin esterase